MDERKQLEKAIAAHFGNTLTHTSQSLWCNCRSPDEFGFRNGITRIQQAGYTQR